MPTPLPAAGRERVPPREILFPRRDQVELRSYADPPLGRGEVHGRTLASIDSPGSALAALAGAGAGAFPVRPGHAAVLRVDRTGSEVEGIAPGDLLFCQGSNRSTQRFAPRLTLPVPRGLDPATALLARLMGVSMTTLMTTAARPGDLVVITGLGPVGYLAAHLFRISNYEVVAVDPQERRRRQAAASGIARVYPALPVSDPAVAGKAALVVECSGHEAAVAAACEVVRMGAELVLVGTPWARRTDIAAHQVLKAVFYKIMTLRSGWEYELPPRRREFVHGGHNRDYNLAPQTVFSGYEKALAWLAAGKIPVDGLIRRVAPQDAAAVYAALRRREYDELFLIWDWSQFS